MEVKITIAYRWWRENGRKVKATHLEFLQESAEERITDAMSQGYTSGELNDSIRVTTRDEPDGTEYSGWWESSREVKP